MTHMLPDIFLLDGVTVTVFSASGVRETVVPVLVMMDPLLDLALVLVMLLLVVLSMLPPEEGMTVSPVLVMVELGAVLVGVSIVLLL